MNISTTGLHSRQSVFRPYAKRVATLLTGVAVTMALTVPAVPAMAINGGQDNGYMEETPGTLTGDTQGGETPDNQGAEPPQVLGPIGIDDKPIVSYSKSGYPIYSDGTTEIPADVTAIGSEEYKGNTDLRIVVLPKSVIKVDESAFQDCTNLTDVIFPYESMTIGKSAFQGCSSLKQVALWLNGPINVSAFQDCTSLTQFAWFSKTTSSKTIATSAFSGCTNLSEITVPESVNIIAANAFKNCTSLSEIHGLSEEKVEHWKTYAGSFTQTNPRPATTAPFKDLSCFASINQSVETIVSLSNGGYPIYADGTAYIPQGVTTIAAQAFRDCTSLRNVTIPSTVTTIGDLAFYDCTSLKQVVIKDGVTTIGSEAFKNCTSLTGASIPSTVTTIGNKAFADTQLWYFSDIYGSITSAQLRTLRDEFVINDPFLEEVTITAQPQEDISTTEATIAVTTTDERENKQIHIYDGGLTCTITPTSKAATTQPKAEYDSDTNSFKVTDLQPGTQYTATIDNNALGCAATPATVSFTTQEETVIPDPTYTVTFDANGGTLTGSDSIETNVGGLIVDWPANPKRDGYEFDGWFTEDFIQVGSDTVFTEDTTVKASWMKLVDVTWTDWDDSFIYTDNVREDATSTLNHPANPTRPEDEDNTYSFKGWSKSEGTNGNITYKATYNTIPKNAVTWLDGYSDNPVITSVKLANGIGYEDKYPVDPTRDGYRFTGWSDPNTEGNNTTITAQWIKRINVTWLNWDGSELAKTTVDEGDVPAATTQSDPTRPEANNTIYTFKNWSEEAAPNGDVTYKATYNSTEREVQKPDQENPKPNNPVTPGDTDDPTPGDKDDSADVTTPSNPGDKDNSDSQGSNTPSDQKPDNQTQPDQKQPTKQEPATQATQDEAASSQPATDSSQPSDEESLPPRTSDNPTHTPLYMLLAGLVGLVISIVRRKSPTQD